MKLRAKKLAFRAAVWALGAAVVAAWWILPGRRTEVRLPASAVEAVPRKALAVEPIYLQTDPRWASEGLGGGFEPLRYVGCTVCALSMALAHHGIPMDPTTLNRRLTESEGFTRRGWVKWDALRRVTADRVQVLLPSRPTNRDIETALAAGNPVLVKVLLRSGFQHWVLLVGRDGRDYLMKDPLGDGRTLQPLSTLGSDILAVRIVAKRQA
ncbi:hypothetical protein EPO15_17125 [bacterium]|nr:MAG: hypothetical protein EPO15_17125 [bacterium]